MLVACVSKCDTICHNNEASRAASSATRRMSVDCRPSRINCGRRGGAELFAWLIMLLHARPHQIMTNDNPLSQKVNHRFETKVIAVKIPWKEIKTLLQIINRRENYITWLFFYGQILYFCGRECWTDKHSHICLHKNLQNVPSCTIVFDVIVGVLLGLAQLFAHSYTTQRISRFYRRCLFLAIIWLAPISRFVYLVARFRTKKGERQHPFVGVLRS